MNLIKTANNLKNEGLRMLTAYMYVQVF